MDTQSLTPPLSKKPLFVSLLVTLLTLAASLSAGYITEKAVNTRLENFFNSQADQIANTYYNRLHAQVIILEGLRGMWDSTGSFTQHNTTRYLESLNLESVDKTGVSSYFYIPAVPKNKQAEFEKNIRKEPDIPDVYRTYTIHPASEEDFLYPLTYGFPLKGRESVIGLDYGTIPERLDAIVYARDQNALATTKAIILQTTGKPGFFFFLPIYKSGMPTDRPSERRLAFAGVVGASFRSDSAFDQIFGSQNAYPYLNFHIYQGEARSPDRLLYDSDPSFDHVQPRFTATRKISLQNQIWTIVVDSKPNFTLIDNEQKLPLVVFTSGLIMTFLLGIYSIFQFSKIRHSR